MLPRSFAPVASITLAAADIQSALADLRASLVPLHREGCSPAFYPVRVLPTLGFSLVPRRRQERSGPGAGRDAAARKRERLARFLGAASGGAGLVEGIQSDASAFDGSNPPGFCGLTRHGARMIEAFCRIWRDQKHLFAVWTVTLPPDLAVALDGIDGGYAQFQGVLRRRFSEALARACRRHRGRAPCHPDWCFVCEPQKSGRPHLHFVFRSRARMGGTWHLSTAALDRLIGNAAAVVIGRPVDVSSAGNVQSIQKDMGRYLSSYLKKGVGATAAMTVLLSGWTWNLVPARWWGLSTTARRIVFCHTVEVPGCLVGWLSLQWRGLVAAGLMKAAVWDLAGDGAPSVVVGFWRDVGDFAQTLRYLHDFHADAVGSNITFGIT